MEFSDKTLSELKLLEPKLLEYIQTSNQPINDILSHIFSSGGKRIRPTIFLLCSDLIGYDGPHKFPIAAVSEYIHTASLLHDDVIDNSTLRRNKPTVNSVWGDETAVLAGDLIYSAACRLMVKSQNLDVIDTYAECIRFMSECELFQLEMLWNSKIDVAQYEKLVSGKTAILFEASAKCPGYLNNSSCEEVALLSEFGKNIGMAFQIADDCLDYTATEEIAGKPITADLLEGKVTLPLIYGLESNNNELIGLVDKILENGTADNVEKQELRNLVVKTGGLSRATAKAKDHIQKSVEAIELIAKNHHFSATTPHIVSNIKELTSLII